MGEVAKWAILAAVVITIISMCVAFPITQYIKVDVYLNGITTVIDVAGDALLFGRGLLNNFLSPWARTAVSGLMIWLIGKWLLTYTVRVTSIVYHWIFK